MFNRYTAVQIKNCLKSSPVIKVATMKNMDDLHCTKKAIMYYHQNDTFHCHYISKDKWNAKEETSKSMENALFVLQYAKGTSWAEAL